MRVEEKQQHKRSLRGLLKIVLFIAVLIIGLFIFLEIALRLFGFDSYQVDFSVYDNVPGDITPRQDIVWRLDYIDHSFHISINEQGFRNPGKLTPDARYRIMCLGDSSTMGYGVDDDKTYPARLSTFLQYQYPGLCDVVNAGTIGYTIDDERAYLEEKGFRLEPDLIVLEVFFNDVIEKVSRERVTQRAFRKKSLPYCPLKSLFLKSALYHALRNISVFIIMQMGNYFPENPYDKVDLALNPDDHPEVWNDYEKGLRDFISTVRNHDVDLIVVVSPDKYQLYHWGYPLYDLEGNRAFQERVIKVLEDEKVSYIDLMPVFKKRMETNKALFVTYGLYDEHQSDIGQLIKAEEVYRSVQGVFEKEGIESLYTLFPMTEITAPEDDGGAHKARKWTSHDDRIGIALVGNVDMVFPGIRLGDEPSLLMDTALPWWTEPDRKNSALKFTLKVSDSLRSDSAPRTVFEYNYENDKASPITRQNVINLNRWKNRTITLTFSLRWEPTSPTREAPTPPRLFLPAPLIVNGTPKGTIDFSSPIPNAD